jgi:hypothetical protein
MIDSGPSPDFVRQNKLHHARHALVRMCMRPIDPMEQFGGALAVANKLLDDLNSRSGFSMDMDVRDEIRRDWIKLLEKAPS